jgi:hypothetical protein
MIYVFFVFRWNELLAKRGIRAVCTPQMDGLFIEMERL